MKIATRFASRNHSLYLTGDAYFTAKPRSVISIPAISKPTIWFFAKVSPDFFSVFISRYSIHSVGTYYGNNSNNFSLGNGQIIREGGGVYFSKVENFLAPKFLAPSLFGVFL